MLERHWCTYLVIPDCMCKGRLTVENFNNILFSMKISKACEFLKVIVSYVATISTIAYVCFTVQCYRADGQSYSWLHVNRSGISTNNNAAYSIQCC